MEGVIGSFAEVYYYHNDHLGSPMAVTDSESNVAWSQDYLPYGQALNEEAVATKTRFTFTGKEYDAASGLYYYNSRWYDADLGRFVSEDTYAGDPNNPVSLNRYIYVNGNPLKYVDPTGNRPADAGEEKKEKERKVKEPDDVKEPEPPEPEKPDPVKQEPEDIMSLSEQGLEFLKEYEDFHGGKKYQDQAGNWTIGYGHKIQEGEEFGEQITEEQAKDLLKSDLNKFENALNKDLKAPVTQNEYDALVILEYNIGIGSEKTDTGYLSSTVRQKVNDPEKYGEVLENNFTDWNKVRENGVPVPSRGLTNRRLDEWEMFKYGDYKRDHF